MNLNSWNNPTAETIKYLTDDELRRFFDAIKKNPKNRVRKRDICLFSLMLAYGLRQAEAIGLRLEHLNLKENQIFIKRVKRQNAGRWCNISEENQKYIKVWLKERDKSRFAQTNPYLFITQKSRREEGLSGDQLYFISRRYGKAAGIERMHPHVLRHTCGVKLAKAGFNAFAIRDRLGHSSVISTQVYVELAHPDSILRDHKMDMALIY
jgi:type 1 fimbriae regulatory protein FimB